VSGYGYGQDQGGQGWPPGQQPAGYGQPAPAGYQQHGSVGYQQQAPQYGQPYGAPAGYPGGSADPPGYYMGRTLASWGARVGAHFIDALIVSIPLLLALPFLIAIVAATTTTNPDGTTSGPSALFVVLFIVAYVVEIAVSLYNTVFLQGRTGQTWGKRIVKLRLVSMRDGQPLGPGMAFVRGLAHVLDSYSFVGYLWPIWDDRRQTFADKVCKTVVLHEG